MGPTPRRPMPTCRTRPPSSVTPRPAPLRAASQLLLQIAGESVDDAGVRLVAGWRDGGPRDVRVVLGTRDRAEDGLRLEGLEAGRTHAVVPQDDVGVVLVRLLPAELVPVGALLGLHRRDG